MESALAIVVAIMSISQSARMSKITNDGLTRSETICFTLLYFNLLKCVHKMNQVTALLNGAG